MSISLLGVPVMEEVILVDENDTVIGIGEKTETHIMGKLHRAFSIFVFDAKGRLLLQKRAMAKYHSGSLWSNTCCSHPRPGESTETAAHRRLKEEMGFDCEVQEIFEFIYKTEVGNNLLEYEYDHVFVGVFGGYPTPSMSEVDDWKWIEVDTLVNSIRANPYDFTHWLKISMTGILTFWTSQSWKS